MWAVELIEKAVRAAETRPLAAAFYLGALFVVALAGCVAVAWRLLGFRRDLDDVHRRVSDAEDGVGALAKRVGVLEGVDATAAAQYRSEMRALRSEFRGLRDLIIGVLRKDGPELRALAAPQAEDDRG